MCVAPRFRFFYPIEPKTETCYAAVLTVMDELFRYYADTFVVFYYIIP